MTTPAIVPAGYNGDSSDFLRVVRGNDGSLRQVVGTVSVASGTLADAFVGLVPFQKGARFVIGDKSVHCGNFGAGTTTVNLGIIYNDDSTYTNDPDAFASLSTAAQSGGFITVDEIEGMVLETEADGWLAIQLKAAAADATANVQFSVGVIYGAE